MNDLKLFTLTWAAFFISTPESQVNIHAGTIHIHHPGRHVGPSGQARLRRRTVVRRAHAGQSRAPEYGHLSRRRRAGRAGDGEVRPQRAAAVEVGMTAPARRASLRLLYDSKDISADLAPYLKSFSFTDSFKVCRKKHYRVIDKENRTDKYQWKKRDE